MVDSQKPTATKRYRLRELITKGLPIWVQNNTTEFARLHKVKGGALALQVGEGTNYDRIIIPPGPDPVCLSDQIDITLLSKCRDLFKMVDSGVLKLLDPENAEDYYQHNEERREIMRKKIEDQRAGKKEEEIVAEKVTETEVKVDPGMIDVCLLLKHKAEGMTDDQKVGKALERLEENRGTYTSEDLMYLLNNGKFPKIKAWAKAELSTLEISE